MTVHIPVLLDEVVELLAIGPGMTVVDGTMGGGGHTFRMAELVGPEGRVIAFDRDPGAVDAIAERLPSNVTAVAANYADIPEHLDQLGIPRVDAILLDLGLSSDQLASPDRGFSFHSDGELDLRFDPMRGEPAHRLINRLGEKHLANLIYHLGEEKYSRRIARKIVEVRRTNPIRTAREFADLVRSCVPRGKNHSIDPATRTFQAFRIAVNEELKWLEVAVRRLPQRLNVGGRIGMISFHSLEDRIVKNGLRDNPLLELVTRRPVTASEQELERNPRARSAKFRVAERAREVPEGFVPE